MSVLKKIKNVMQKEQKMEICVTIRTIKFRVNLSSLTSKETESLHRDKLCVLWKRGNYKEFGLKNSKVSDKDGFFEYESTDYFQKVAAFRLNKVGLVQ
jgi:hypothetical protein